MREQTELVKGSNEKLLKYLISLSAYMPYLSAGLMFVALGTDWDDSELLGHLLWELTNKKVSIVNTHHLTPQIYLGAENRGKRPRYIIYF